MKPRTTVKISEVAEYIANRWAFETNRQTMRGFTDFSGVYGVYSYNTCIAQYDGVWKLADRGGYGPHREIVICAVNGW